METSSSRDEIYAALLRAQRRFPKIEKTRTGRTASRGGSLMGEEREYKYADLSDVLEAVKPVLNRNGVLLIQAPAIVDGMLVVRSRLIHAKSGQWIQADYPVCSLSGDHQRMGGGFTYARRYAACGILGITAEDDTDGEDTVEETAPPPPQPKRETRRQPPKVVQGIEGQRPLPPLVGAPDPEAA